MGVVVRPLHLMRSVHEDFTREYISLNKQLHFRGEPQKRAARSECAAGRGKTRFRLLELTGEFAEGACDG